MLSRLSHLIWYPSSLPDRLANLGLLGLVLLLFIFGFDYAKVPVADFLDLRASPMVQSAAIAALVMVGCLTVWGLARDEYVETRRSILPSILSYFVLALLCCTSWLVRGLFALESPYRLDVSAPISWSDVRQIAICGQVFLLANLGTLYVKKADGSAVRAFAASNARVRRLLRRLFTDHSSDIVLDVMIESLRNELKALASKKYSLDATLHAGEAEEANRICTAAERLRETFESLLIITIKADPATALACVHDSLTIFGIIMLE